MKNTFKTRIATIEYMLEKLSGQTKHNSEDIVDLQSMLKELAVDMAADLAQQEGTESPIRQLVAVADDKESLAARIKQTIAAKAP